MPWRAFLCMLIFFVGICCLAKGPSKTFMSYAQQKKIPKPNPKSLRTKCFVLSNSITNKHVKKRANPLGWAHCFHHSGIAEIVNQAFGDFDAYFGVLKLLGIRREICLDEVEPINAQC